MSETDRMSFYTPLRVLIDSGRILNPTVKDGTVYLAAAHLEMLRNLTQYLHRRSTFVSEYESMYYLMPDDTDWDSIEQIVAELEYRLMPGKVTMWGYTDRLFSQVDDTVPSGTTLTQMHPLVPDDTLWRILGVSIYTDSDTAFCYLYGKFGATLAAIQETVQLTPQLDTVVHPIDVVLKAGDRFQIYYYGLQQGQRVLSTLWGYTMDTT